MNHSEYKEAKKALKMEAENIKMMTNDKPMIRQVINDKVDSLLKLFPKSFSYNRVKMYEDWLSSYAVTLHPKS